GCWGKPARANLPSCQHRLNRDRVSPIARCARKEVYKRRSAWAAPGLVPHQEGVFESQAKRVALGAIVRIVSQLAARPLGDGLTIPAFGELGFIVGHQISAIAFGARQRLFFEIAVYDPLAISA